MLVHATSVATRTPDGWLGVLLTGPSGSGKSDLALRLLDRGWRLVADDYTRVWRSGPALYGSLDPARGAAIAGLIEVRGLGPSPTRPPLPLARLGLVVRCGMTSPERLPAPEIETLLDFPLPTLSVDVRPTSAAELVSRALDLARANMTGV
jgi:hypothetical protein